jgi:hypothetical protein
MKTEYILALCISVVAVDAFGHFPNVHRAITVNTAASASSSSLGYADFLSTISSDVFLKDATNSMVEGSAHEDDDPAQDPVGGIRSFNHFYDPLTGLGLSDFPPDRRVTMGTNSFTWASVSNCPALDFEGKVFGIHVSKIKNIGKHNVWSWQNARGYEWLGLTATNATDRNAALTNLFRCLGQVVHLLQDTSQPQHVRNEQHLDVSILVIGTPWISPIENYGKDNVPRLNYQHSMLSWRADGFTKMEDFWNRHQYASQRAQALVADASTNGSSTARLGLAEFSNGNFLGARHLFPEYFTPGDIEYYPFPSRDHSTDYSDIRSHPEHGIDLYQFPDGTVGKGIYIAKTGDGVYVQHISRINYLGAKIHGLTGSPYCTIDDPNVLQDYHDILIPKAVEYSAGLLDYFFRGTMDVGDVKYDSGTGQYTCTAINTSGQDFHAGSLFIYDDDNGVRTLLTSITLDGTTWANHTSTTLTFPSPSSTNENLLLVYQGTIGWTNNSPLDPVDAGIGIAVKAFTLQSEITTSGFAFEWGHGSMYSDRVGWSGFFSPQDANGNSWDCSIISGSGNGANISNAARFDLSGGGSGAIQYTITRSGWADVNAHIILFENGADILDIGVGGQDNGTFFVPFTTDGGGRLELHISAQMWPWSECDFDIKGTIYLP